MSSLPLDLTGVSATNLIANEEHTLDIADKFIIVLTHGAFFTESLDIRRMDNGDPLVPGADYKALQLNIQATKDTSKEVCHMIKVRNDYPHGQLMVTYQALGSEQYTIPGSVIDDMIDALDVEFAVSWGEILNTPSQYPAAAHLHHLNELYGYEGVILLLSEIRKAVERGHDGVYQLIYNHVETLIDELRTIDIATVINSIDALTQTLNGHSTNTDNPHTVTKGQVGLGNVSNYVTGTVVEGNAETPPNDRFATPALVKSMIDYWVTLERLNLDDVPNIPLADAQVLDYTKETIVYGDPGTYPTSDLHLMTVNQIFTAIDNFVEKHVNLETAHTKAQVGLSDVPNWRAANLTDSNGDNYVDLDTLTRGMFYEEDPLVETMLSDNADAFVSLKDVVTLIRHMRPRIYVGDEAPDQGTGEEGDIYFIMN